VLLLASDSVGIAGITAGATVAVGLAVALITAKTTNDRQQRQLSEEAKRLATTLKHERELADLDDIRKVLDEATLALSEASDAAKRSRHRVFGEIHDSTDPSTRRQTAEEIESELRQISDPLSPLLARLRVRLGSTDPIAHAFYRARLATLELVTCAVSARSGSIEKVHDQYRATEDRLNSAIPEFSVPAVQRYGTVMSRND
jgi:hypothetical protein